LLRDNNYKRYERACARRRSERRPDGPSCRVIATVVGRLDGPDKLTVHDKAGNTIVYHGFGHLGLYRTRLVIERVEDVVVIK